MEYLHCMPEQFDPSAVVTFSRATLQPLAISLRRNFQLSAGVVPLNNGKTGSCFEPPFPNIWNSLHGVSIHIIDIGEIDEIDIRSIVTEMHA